MQSNIEKFKSALEALGCNNDDDLVGELYEITGLVEKEEDISACYGSIFRFIENNMEADVGSPGPLTHLIEKDYPEYVPQLIQSLSKKPSESCVFMLHRIMNSDIPTEDKSQYLALLNSISSNQDADEIARSEAKEYYEYHSN